MSSAHLVVGGVGRPGLVPVLEQAERPVLGHPPLRVAVPAVHLGGAPDHVAVGLVDAVVVGVVHGGLAVHRAVAALDRKSVVSGKSVSVRLDLVGRRSIKKKKIITINQ